MVVLLFRREILGISWRNEQQLIQITHQLGAAGLSLDSPQHHWFLTGVELSRKLIT